MTRGVNDEQFGKFGKRRRDLERRPLEGSVPYDLAMDGLQAIVEHDQPRLADAVGPIYPRGTIALTLEMDLTLSLEERVRRGQYCDRLGWHHEITEDRYPINRDERNLQYSLGVLLVPPYFHGIELQQQEEKMLENRLCPLGFVEVLAVGEQFPQLQLGYEITHIVPLWRGIDRVGDGSTFILSGRQGRDLERIVRTAASPQGGNVRFVARALAT